MEPIFQLKKEKETSNEGIFILEPLEAGYGLTLGNALRRTLLTSLSGAAITFVKIDGVKHQFSTLSGLKEDVVELILNLKKVRIRLQVEGPVKIGLEATGPGEVTAQKIKTTAGVEVVNQDLILCHLADKKSKINCEMTVEKGFGYSSFEERKTETLGVIPLDAIFSPVARVNYNIETTRVGRVANYDRLVMEITTDGTIKPSEAINKAAQILSSYFKQILEPKTAAKTKAGAMTVPAEVLKLTIEELSLPTRIANALDKNGYKTVEDLLGAKRKDLAKIKNLGEKSLKIVDIALVEKGVDISQK